MQAYHYLFLLVLTSIMVSPALLTSAFPTNPSSLFSECRRQYTCPPHMAKGFSSSEESPSFDMSELSRRIDSLQTVDKVLGDDVSTVYLPVVAFDQLLPNQRIQGRTTDDNFGRMLGELGLGGLFAMVSVNHAKRMVRRNGVICRIELVDTPGRDLERGTPLTAIDFQVVALRRCRVVGPPAGMKARCGRWRRSHDPDGEASVCGFAVERFVDVPEEVASILEQESNNNHENERLPITKWTDIPVDISISDSDANDPAVIEMAKSIVPLLEKWEKLASDVKTYDNTEVVVASRVMHGQPGLRVDPAALLRRVHTDLGERPPPSDPTAFALWGAALINPLPALGVSPEIRGRVLEAPDSLSKLNIVEWATKRSIANLEGTAPL